MFYAIYSTLAEVLITKSIFFMKDLFVTGGPFFMWILTVLFFITTAWIISQFVIAYKSKAANLDKALRKIGYGKSMGLFALTTGVMGQMVGFSAMFHAMEGVIASGGVLKPEMIYGGIRVTMIVTIYGMLIYLVSILLYLLSSILLEKKLNSTS